MLKLCAHVCVRNRKTNKRITSGAKANAQTNFVRALRNSKVRPVRMLDVVCSWSRGIHCAGDSQGFCFIITTHIHTRTHSNTQLFTTSARSQKPRKLQFSSNYTSSASVQNSLPVLSVCARTVLQHFHRVCVWQLIRRSSSTPGNASTNCERHHQNSTCPGKVLRESPPRQLHSTSLAGRQHNNGIHVRKVRASEFTVKFQRPVNANMSLCTTSSS